MQLKDNFAEENLGLLWMRGWMALPAQSCSRCSGMELQNLFAAHRTSSVFQTAQSDLCKGMGFVNVVGVSKGNKCSFRESSAPEQQGEVVTQPREVISWGEADMWYK